MVVQSIERKGEERGILPVPAARALWQTPRMLSPRFLTGILAATLAQGTHGATATELPNFVVIFTDDQGYADVGCYGATEFETPNLDRLAREGMRFTDFHVSQAVCSASRASLLTGCYAERVGIQGALNAQSRIGLHPDEETIAEILAARGYRSGIFGKWHLGHHEPFLPLQHGFDEFAGLPYSNDMWPVGYDGRSQRGTEEQKSFYPELKYYEGNAPVDVIADLADQDTLTTRATRRAVEFLEQHHSRPFFLYVPHSMPHVPLGVSDRFRGKSPQGLYGDVMMEIDWSVGEILDALERCGVADDTLVVFTSDNGPWLNFGNHAGSASPLREGKGNMWEGGCRVPCIMRWPATIPAGSTCHQLAATMDLLPTFAALAGASLPAHTIDGVNLVPLLKGQVDVRPRESLAYYYNAELVAVRRGPWKLMFPHHYRSYAGVEPGRDGLPGPYSRGQSELSLFHLERDVGEKTDVLSDHPEVVAELQQLGEMFRTDLGDRRTKRTGKDTRGVGRLPPLRDPVVDHLAVGKSVRLSRPPSPRYQGLGAKTLSDGKLASEDFHDPGWLGFEGEDVDIVIDLGESVPLREVRASFLQDQRSWIFLPAGLQVAVSIDGDHYRTVHRSSQIAQHSPAQVTDEVSFPVSGIARFVRVRVIGVKQCPDWHPGKGGKAWVFVDEIQLFEQS